MNQKIKTLSEPFPHLIVENMYNNEELDLIWEELDFLSKPHKFLQEDDGTGKDEKTGLTYSTSKSILLDDVYTQRSTSNILTINRKLFLNEFIQPFSEILPICKSILYQNSDSTKIRYYENNDEYLPHQDFFNYTSITFFYKNPKMFDGGDLYFPDFNYIFKCENNHTILFPSCIFHGASCVKMKDTKNCNGYGRYSMMQFLKLV